jgi:isoquinoline 1-oxidoreductase subunit beta
MATAIATISAAIRACVRRSTKPPPDRRTDAEMGNMPTISRRQFIVSSAAFAGGMALGAVSADSVDAAFLGPVPWVETDALPSAEFTPWISIGADDIVTVRVATPEIGNGAMTQTPMLVAEELACDWNKIRAEFAPTSRDHREDKRICR